RSNHHAPAHPPVPGVPFVLPTVTVPPQLSVAVAVPSAVFTAGSRLVLHWIVASTGQVIAGGVLFTWISCTQLVLLLQLSVAVHVRAIEYVCGQLVPVVTSL